MPARKNCDAHLMATSAFASASAPGIVYASWPCPSTLGHQLTQHQTIQQHQQTNGEAVRQCLMSLSIRRQGGQLVDGAEGRA